MSNRFYLACFRDNVGSNVGFHRVNGKGYTTNIEEAHEYTREEAQRAWDFGREYDQPICADSVDELAVYKVDCQYIPNKTEIGSKSDKNTQFVAFRKGAWDGNDVYWKTERTPSTDFRKAICFSINDSIFNAADHLVIIPFELADTKKRLTFDFDKFDRRRMVQYAGLKQPEWYKKHKRSRCSGKTRWNCPSCGKISWQYSPYDFDGCSDVNCKEWRHRQ